jgi:hypothetical protein
MVLITSTKGTHGEGSFQLFIEVEFEQHSFTLREYPRHRERLQMKLRTVVWDYVGEPIPKTMLDDLKRFGKDGLPEPLADLLDAHEQQALRVRAQALADYARFPEDRGGPRYPWPLV